GEVVGEELPALDRPKRADCGEERHLHGAQEHQCEPGTQCHRLTRRAPSTWSLLHRSGARAHGRHHASSPNSAMGSQTASCTARATVSPSPKSLDSICLPM